MRKIVAARDVALAIFLLLSAQQFQTISTTAAKTAKTVKQQVTALLENHKLELDDTRRDVILVTGRTGTGKTTMMEILFGEVSSLESSMDEKHLSCNIRNVKANPGKKEHPMLQSDTTSPQMFTDPKKPSVAIYDCPGFADTRGTSNEIATGVYLKEIVRHAERVKIIVVVDYDTIKPRGDRDKFTDGIVPEVLDFVHKNSRIYEGGVFLLVTKYSNPNESPNKKFDDDKIVKAIAEFLQEALKEVTKKTNDEKRRSATKALFGKSWLKKVDGKYSNIGFSRYINEEGKLSNMEGLTRRNKIRDQLLKNPSFEFKNSDPEAFGCPISEGAKLEIREFQGDLMEEAHQLLRTVVRSVVAKVKASTDKTLLNRLNVLWDSLGVLNNKDSAWSDKAIEVLSEIKTTINDYMKEVNGKFDRYDLFLKQLKTDSGFSYENLEALRVLGRDIQADIGNEVDKMKEIFTSLKYLTGVDGEQSSTTWLDAHTKWNDTIKSMTEGIDRLKADVEIHAANQRADIAALMSLIGPAVKVASYTETGAAFIQRMKMLVDVGKARYLEFFKLM